MGRSTYRAGANIAHLPALNNVVKSLHDLLAGRLPVQTVDLQHIDVRAQPLNTGIDRIEDMLPGETDAVDEGAIIAGRGRDGREVAFVVDAEEALGQDDDAVAGDVVLLQGFADDGF